MSLFSLSQKLIVVVGVWMLVSPFCGSLSFVVALHGFQDRRADNWSAYGHDPAGTRYSSLDQINRSNVQQLKAAWTYHTGALQPESELNKKAAFESTPILVEGKLYLSTPYDQVIALDP